MRQLATGHLTRHAEPKKRAGPVRDDHAMLDQTIVPALGARKVADVRQHDIETLHQGLKATPYRASRVLALLSKMFGLSIAPDWRADNPVKGVERFPEERRERRLAVEELRRLSEALDGYRERRAANGIRPSSS